eukprot:Pgem_evm1s3941
MDKANLKYKNDTNYFNSIVPRTRLGRVKSAVVGSNLHLIKTPLKRVISDPDHLLVEEKGDSVLIIKKDKSTTLRKRSSTQAGNPPTLKNIMRATRKRSTSVLIHPIEEHSVTRFISKVNYNMARNAHISMSKRDGNHEVFVIKKKTCNRDTENGGANDKE